MNQASFMNRLAPKIPRVIAFCFALFAMSLFFMTMLTENDGGAVFLMYASYWPISGVVLRLRGLITAAIPDTFLDTSPTMDWLWGACAFDGLACLFVGTAWYYALGRFLVFLFRKMTRVRSKY